MIVAAPMFAQVETRTSEIIAMLGDWVHWQVRLVEHRVEEAEPGVVEVLPEQDADDRRQHHRQVDGDPQVAAEMAQLVEEERERERNAVAEDEREPGELERVPDGREEERIGEEVPVVVEPHPDRIGDEVDLLEAEQDPADERVPRKEREAEDRAGHQRIGGRVLGQPAPEARASQRRANGEGRRAHGGERSGPRDGGSPRPTPGGTSYVADARIELTWLSASESSCPMLASLSVSTFCIAVSSTA
jgi:hypothetical protein